MSDIRLVNGAHRQRMERCGEEESGGGQNLDGLREPSRLQRGRCQGKRCEPRFGFADDLMKAPAVDPESRRPVSHWVLQRSVAYCERCRKGYRITNGGANVLTFSYCPNCGAKMEDNNA